MLRKLRPRAFTAVLAATGAGLIGGIPAAAGEPANHVRARVASSSCQDDLAVAYWACAWSKTGFKGTKWEFGNGSSSYPSLGRANDRGVSVLDAGGGRAMRLYRYKNFRGAWICFPAGQKVGNLGFYVFDNGAGRPGYGATVARHFESIGFSGSKCTNPM